ncbi:hypothetical protein [Yoonia vestfoldensis]|jgi:hypothetical protein|uniref:DUF4145 domain-containing protein n=1 Tax=Yoonia vestfoldensis TaxID=245188 RepID=A0A1Y0E9U2_9RHOB|nr:hypothetical protein [Yoonia vestfoldensis]ARU00384.1 hypothetical protein LOKVESSMR4R_01056 [Yoonia vestfoldensis]
MRRTVKSVHLPVWSNAEHTAIDCVVKFAEWRTEGPFTASPIDPEAHGRELFHRLVNGEFGPIGPFKPSANPDEADAMLILDAKADWSAKWPELEMFLQEANAENARGTMRGIGLVWGIMLDDMLVRVMEGQGASSIPSGFKDKITVAAQEDIITTKERDALHAIRHIRDRCAHQWNLSFSNPEVEVVYQHFNALRKEFVSDLKETKDLEELMKLVYSSACCALIIGFTTRL